MSDGITSIAGLRKAVERIRASSGFRQPLLDAVIDLISEFEAGVRGRLKILDECDDNETFLDEELCKKCPLYNEGEAGMFCSYSVFRRVLGEEGAR